MANERSLVEEQNRYDRILELAPAKEAVSIDIAFVFVIKWSPDINYWSSQGQYYVSGVK